MQLKDMICSVSDSTQMAASWVASRRVTITVGCIHGQLNSFSFNANRVTGFVEDSRVDDFGSSYATKLLN